MESRKKIKESIIIYKTLKTLTFVTEMNKTCVYHATCDVSDMLENDKTLYWGKHEVFLHVRHL